MEKKQEKKVLAIETSCDETAVALVSYANGMYTPLGQELYSQIDIHKEYGGVFPMLAKREHGKNLLFLTEKLLGGSGTPISISEEHIQKALTFLDREVELQNFFKECIHNSESFLHKKPDVDMIAVTAGPGLEPALWVGISFAKALSTLWNIEVLPINHMEGHIVSVLADSADASFPALALLISGGHTELVYTEQWGSYHILGGTKDDAVGEAYDKVARILSLTYPGGPEISKKAEYVRSVHTVDEAESLCATHNIKLPRPMLHSNDTSFSFSGLKTAVLYLVRDLKKNLNTEILPEDIVNLICFEFEESVVEVLIKKLETAKEQKAEIKSLIVGGGVIANTYIRKHLSDWCVKEEIIFLKPTQTLSTDNAVMIGIAALVQMIHSYAKPIQPENIVARGGWKVDELY